MWPFYLAENKEKKHSMTFQTNANKYSQEEELNGV